MATIAACLARTPTARVIVQLMAAARDDPAKSKAVFVAEIEGNVPALVVASIVIGNFQSSVYVPDWAVGRLCIFLLITRRYGPVSALGRPQCP